MNTFTATLVCEGVESVDSEERLVAAWQHLIDTEICSSLQGSFLSGGPSANQSWYLSCEKTREHIRKETPTKKTHVTRRASQKNHTNDALTDAKNALRMAADALTGEFNPQERRDIAAAIWRRLDAME